MNEKDLGTWWEDEHGEAWQLIGYCDRPTATLERVDDRLYTHRVHGAVGAPVFKHFTKLHKAPIDRVGRRFK